MNAQVEPRPQDERRLLSIEELAAYLDVPIATLRTWRANHAGPRGIRVGREAFDRAPRRRRGARERERRRGGARPSDRRERWADPRDDGARASPQRRWARVGRDLLGRGPGRRRNPTPNRPRCFRHPSTPQLSIRLLLRARSPTRLPTYTPQASIENDCSLDRWARASGELLARRLATSWPPFRTPQLKPLE